MGITKQLSFLEKQTKSYGGELMKTRRGRKGSRPLATGTSMHLVLRSSRAVGKHSFKRHKKKIKELVAKFSEKYHVKVYSMANVGNHLHFHIKLFRRRLYAPFIRALTSSLMMAVTGASRWKPYKNENNKIKFWDYRPFTRVLQSFREFLNLRDYIEINQMEGVGFNRKHARYFINNRKAKQPPQRRQSSA